VQIAFTRGGRAVPSFVALLASLFPGILRWPRTYWIRTALGQVWESLVCSGYLRATSWNSLKIDCKEPVEGPSSCVATLRLSKNT